MAFENIFQSLLRCLIVVSIFRAEIEGHGTAVIETCSHHPASLPFGRNVAVPWSDVSRMYNWSYRSSFGDCSAVNITLRDVLQKLVRVHSKLGQHCITSAGIAWKYLFDNNCKVSMREMHKGAVCDFMETND